MSQPQPPAQKQAKMPAAVAPAAVEPVTVSPTTVPVPVQGGIQLTIPTAVTQGLSSLDKQASAAIGIPRIQSTEIIGQFDWLILLVSNIVIFLIFVLILQYAWNNSIKDVFKLSENINLWEAFLILIVSRILFH